jgi:hypothetical protein
MMEKSSSTMRYKCKVDDNKNMTSCLKLLFIWLFPVKIKVVDVVDEMSFGDEFEDLGD